MDSSLSGATGPDEADALLPRLGKQLLSRVCFRSMISLIPGSIISTVCVIALPSGRTPIHHLSEGPNRRQPGNLTGPVTRR